MKKCRKCAEITLEMKNADGTAYEHCVLSVDGEGFLALAEAKNPCDIDLVHRYLFGCPYLP